MQLYRAVGLKPHKARVLTSFLAARFSSGPQAVSSIHCIHCYMLADGFWYTLASSLYIDRC